MRYLVVVSVFFFMLVMGVFATAQADGRGVYVKCIGCHGVDGSKHALNVSPPIKGQSAGELERKLFGYLDGSFGGDKKIVMTNVLKKLSEEDIREVSKYVSEF